MGVRKTLPSDWRFTKPHRRESMRRFILRSYQSPCDVLMQTAAVCDLHLAFPGQYQTYIRTSASAIWEHNSFTLIGTAGGDDPDTGDKQRKPPSEVTVDVQSTEASFQTTMTTEMRFGTVHVTIFGNLNRLSHVLTLSFLLDIPLNHNHNLTRA